MMYFLLILIIALLSCGDEPGWDSLACEPLFHHTTAYVHLNLENHYLSLNGIFEPYKINYL
jgi:hypothetical protein